MSPSKIDIVTLIARVKNIVDMVAIEGNYVVIVCPNLALSTSLSRIVGTLVSEKGEFSGRTAVLPNNGKVSVVCADDEVFISDDESFNAEFLGWTAKDNSQGMLKWQSKATV